MRPEYCLKNKVDIYYVNFQVRIIDCYLVEGVKVLYRVVLSILILFTKYSGKILNSVLPLIMRVLKLLGLLKLQDQ